MNRLSHSENQSMPWVNVNDDLPNNSDIVEVMTTNDLITVAQFHVGLVGVLPDGTGVIKKRPCFGFVDPQDLTLEAVITAWRHILI